MKLQCVDNIYIKPVCFKSDKKPSEYLPIEKSEKASPNRNYSFSAELSKKIDGFYSDYTKSLGETSFNDINKTVSNIVENSEYSRKEVLETMQTLTQFANMRSIKYISDELFKRDICTIGNGDNILEQYTNREILNNNHDIKNALTNDFGLNATLFYLIDSKKLGKLKHENYKDIAIFLDNNKLDLLEKAKEKNPDEFKKIISNKKYKFIILSGFETGISFVDRTKNLEEETIKLLDLSNKLGMPPDTAIDYETKQRSEKLGITPIIIKKEGFPTTTCVYRQMTPEKMSKTDLYNLLKINAHRRDPNNKKNKNDSLNKSAIDYLNKNLKIYTPETYSKALKDLHSMIIDYAEAKGKSPEDIIYVVHNKNKSYQIVNYCYSKINNIPAKQFVKMNTLENDKSKLFVILDDCSLSGDSTTTDINRMNCYLQGNKTDTLFAYICGTKNAIKNFTKDSNTALMFKDTINSQGDLSKKALSKAVGNSSFAYGKTTTCLVLPYMAPDNNSDLAANIAALHNPVYRTSNSSKIAKDIYLGYGIKNDSDITIKIMKDYYKNIGYEPKIEEEKQEKNLFSKFIDYITNKK